MPPPPSIADLKWKKLVQTWRPGREDNLNQINITASHALAHAVNAVVPFSTASTIHDIGTGSGAVLAALFTDFPSQLPPSATILATDVSPMMLDEIRERQRLALDAVQDPKVKDLWTRVQIREVDGQAMTSIADSSVSHATAGYVVYGVPSHQSLFSEIRRTLQPGGVFGYTVNTLYPWVTVAGVITEIRPDRSVPSPPAIWSTAASNRAVMEGAGFEDVTTTEIDLEFGYDSYEKTVDFLLDVLPFAGMLVDGLTDDELTRYKGLMVEELKRGNPSLPAKIKGKGLTVVGRK